jgi:hypothetical protein
MQPPPPPRMHRVRVRASIRETVPIRRTTTQEPALHPSLHTHRRQHPMPSTHHLTLRLSTQQHHQRLMHRAVQLDRPARFRQRHLHPCRGQPSNDLLELITVESALVLPHHHRVEPTIRVLGSRQQRGRGRAIRPRPPTRTPLIEELHHDRAETSASSSDTDRCHACDVTASWNSLVDIRP